jgi:tellurite resistance protein TerC
MGNHAPEYEQSTVNGLVGVTYRVARRIAIAVVGFTVLLLGIIMLVTPGPAFLMIPCGLAILGLEFAWARHWLKKARQTISDQAAKTRGNRAEKHRHRP